MLVTAPHRPLYHIHYSMPPNLLSLKMKYFFSFLLCVLQIFFVLALMYFIRAPVRWAHVSLFLFSAAATWSIGCCFAVEVVEGAGTVFVCLFSCCLIELFYFENKSKSGLVFALFGARIFRAYTSAAKRNF